MEQGYNRRRRKDKPTGGPFLGSIILLSLARKMALIYNMGGEKEDLGPGFL